MSSDDEDQVQVVGLTSDPSPPPRRSRTGLVLLAVGLLVGVALGLLLSPSDPDPTATTATLPPVTTTTTSVSPAADELQDQIKDLRSELKFAQQRVFELGLETAPALYARRVTCSSRQQTASGAELGSYFVGPVGFTLVSPVLSGEGDNVFIEVRTVIEAGDSVTLVVPWGERDSVSLFWDPTVWRADNFVGSGAPAVTLLGCDEPTVLVGGFASEWDYCAPLDVYFGDEPVPERIIFPIGNVDCPEGATPLVLPELGPVPAVTGLTVREARRAIRLAALVPVINDGDTIDPDGMVWGQKPGGGETLESGALIGLRTCQPADDVVAAYQERLDVAGVTLSKAWMAPSHDSRLDSWYFVSALVSGGPTDGEVATWTLPAWRFTGEAHSVNTPNLSIPANGTSQAFGFGDLRFTPEDYGVTDWLDLDGAIASQRCVTLGG